MKKLVKQSLALMAFVIGFVLYNIPAGRAQSKYTADAIIGKWQNPDGTRRMEIYKSGNEYFGKIVWVKSDDGSVKVGDVVLKNFSFSNNQWKGTAVAKGNNVDCSITMVNNNSINIKGKMGFISRTKTWTRIQ